ncbi:MAG: hypothetical protein SFV21_08515 [Rhodospirillaceae bacterium]|nr:hypothetical protein [Rhodospirillaceae bacterium]
MMAANRAGIDPELAGEAGDEVRDLASLIARAANARDAETRASALTEARAELARFDSTRHPKLARALRTRMAELDPSFTADMAGIEADVVVPAWVLTPELLRRFVAAQVAQGVDPARIRLPNATERAAAEQDASINPATGMEEFGWWDNAKTWMKSQHWLQDASRTGFRGLASAGRVVGLDLAADHLDHFLDASGEPLTIDPERLWNNRDIAYSANKIEELLADEGLTKGQAKIFPDIAKLDDMKTGESTNLQGLARVSNTDKIPWPLDSGLALGKYNLDAATDLNVTRGSDGMDVDGTITFSMDEPYNFEPDDPGAGAINTLRDTGRAREFHTRSRWAQKVQGKIELDEHGNRKLVRLTRGAPYRLTE